jgi:ribonuclease R
MPVDGLVHISAIPGDYWELENGGMGLVGQRTGRRWQLGDAVRVRLSRVDLTQRQIDFELLDGEGATGHGTVRAPRRGAGGGGDGGGGHHVRRGPGSTSGRDGGSRRGGRGGGAKRGRGSRG